MATRIASWNPGVSSMILPRMNFWPVNTFAFLGFWTNKCLPSGQIPPRWQWSKGTISDFTHQRSPSRNRSPSPIHTHYHRRYNCSSNSFLQCLHSCQEHGSTACLCRRRHVGHVCGLEHVVRLHSLRPVQVVW